MRKFTVGTRLSRLALAQTKSVVDMVMRNNYQVHIDILKINSSGDLDVRPLYTFDKKGIFEKEIDQAVIDGRADFAVHSAKDVPTELFAELELASVPTRSLTNDVLINCKGLRFKELAPGSVIGTSSLRRAVQLLRMRPELKVIPIRGNIETRIKKVESGLYNAIVLAQAGLERVGLTKYVTEQFDIRDLVPAVGQGALALVCKNSDADILKLLKSVEDPRSRAEIEAERNLLAVVEGGCKLPVGAVAVSSEEGETLTLFTKAFPADGSEEIFVTESGATVDAKDVGIRAGYRLLEKGVKDFSRSWEMALKDWNIGQ